MLQGGVACREVERGVSRTSLRRYWLRSPRFRHTGPRPSVTPSDDRNRDVPHDRDGDEATLTSVMTSTETTTSTSTTTTTETTTTTSEVTLPAGCLPYQSNGYSSGTLVAGTSSPAIICVQVYWFNSTSPIVLNATSLLQIEGCEVRREKGNSSLMPGQTSPWLPALTSSRWEVLRTPARARSWHTR